MSNGTKTVLTPKEQIDVLLVLYESLRWDILIRTAGMYTLVAGLMVGLTVIPSALATQKALRISIVAGVAALAVCAVFFWAIYRDITKAAGKLRELEDSINNLAGVVDLLDWEKHYGGAVTSYVGPATPLHKREP